MSNSRSHRRHLGRHRPAQPNGASQSDTPIGICWAWCATEADLPEARQLTHDLLIQQMGSGRRSGITLTWNTGPEALAMVDLAASDPQMTLPNAGEMRERLSTMGGWVVIAMAAGTPPPPTRVDLR